MSNEVTAIAQSNTLINDKVSQANALKLQAEALLATAKVEKDELLKSIPAALGYIDASQFVNEFMVAVGMVAAPTVATETPKKARATITPEMKAAIIEDLKAGVLKTQAIADKHGVSAPSVNLIKSAEGLTKKVVAA